MGDVIFVAVGVALAVVGPLSPLAFGFYWLAGGFFVLAAIFKGIMRLLDLSYRRKMRKLQEQNELHYKQLYANQLEERAKAYREAVISARVEFGSNRRS